MWKSFYAGMAFTELPLFALLLFVTLFGVMLTRIFILKRKQDFDPLAALPLDDSHE